MAEQPHKQEYRVERKMTEMKALSITACKECGSKHMTWQTSILNRSNVQQGRLNTRDVECVFVLGCDECSETLATVSADKFAAHLNANTAVALTP